MNRSCTIQRCAILAVHHPPINPIFNGNKFINTLIKTGITVSAPPRISTLQASTIRQLLGGEKRAGIPAPCSRMFEPQDHPNDFRYPGGPPIPPYDVTGYTLAYQMGVKFDRILIVHWSVRKSKWIAEAARGQNSWPRASGGYLISHQQNDAFILVNRLLKNGDDGVLAEANPPRLLDTIPVLEQCSCPRVRKLAPLLDKAAAEFDLTIQAVPTRPSGDAYKLKPVRIGLWDQYGGSMPSDGCAGSSSNSSFPSRLSIQRR